MIWRGCFCKLTVLFLACFVSQTGGQVVRRGTCPNVGPVENFDVNKMTGMWYLQSLYHYCPQAYVACSVYNMTVSKSNGILEMRFREKFFDSFSKRLRVRDAVKVLNPDKPAVSISEVNTTCFSDVQLCAYVGVGPKYEFFINYCCKTFKKDFKYETMGVRTRDRFPSNETKKMIHDKIESLQLSTEFLYPVDQTHCDKDANGETSTTPMPHDKPIACNSL